MIIADCWNIYTINRLWRLFRKNIFMKIPEGEGQIQKADAPFDLSPNKAFRARVWRVLICVRLTQHTHTYVPTYKQQSGSYRPSPSYWTGGSRTQGWNKFLWQETGQLWHFCREHQYSETTHMQTHSLHALPLAIVDLTSTVTAGKTPMVTVKTKHTERAITQI